MQTAILVFAVLQAVGAIVGALSAVWGEIAYVRARKDGAIDQAERAHLDALARGLRIGMSVVLLSSFVLVVLAYMSGELAQPALTTNYWMLMALSLLVMYVSWALSRRRITFALGSASAFAAWWFIAYLTIGFIPSMSFGAAVALYVVAVGVFYALLRYARFLLVSSS